MEAIDNYTKPLNNKDEINANKGDIIGNISSFWYWIWS